MIARLLERGLYLLGAMDDEGLRACIERPALQAGLVVDPGLVDVLVGEIRDEPGALPLLSHALLKTWNRREGRTLTVDGYRASGGIRGSIAQSAEGVYARVSIEQQVQVRELMLRLVSPGPEGEPLRMRMPRRRMTAGPDHERLLELLVGARLLTSDDGNVTLAHESLARAWPRLRGWLDDDREGQVILHHLSASADAWQELGRPESELYRGIRLTRVTEWQGASPPSLAPVEVDFIAAGLALRDREERSVHDVAARRAIANRRLRALLAVAVVLLVVAASAGVVAQRSARRAAAAATEAEAREVGALAQVTDDAPKALLLAAAAARLDPSAATRAALQQTLAAHPQLIRTAFPPESESGLMAVSPDGDELVVHDTTGGLWSYDAETLAPVSAARVGPRIAGWQGTPVEYSPDGSELAVATVPGEERAVTLLDPTDLSPRPAQLEGSPSHELRADGVAYSDDGSRIAVTITYESGTGERGLLLVWDLAEPGRPVRRLRLESSQGVQLSPDGHTVYLGNPLTAYDVDSGRRLVHNERVVSWLFFEPSPDRTRFAALGYAQGLPNAILIVDAATARITRRLYGLQGLNTYMVAWSADGTRVAATAQDRTARPPCGARHRRSRAHVADRGRDDLRPRVQP